MFKYSPNYFFSNEESLERANLEKITYISPKKMKIVFSEYLEKVNNERQGIKSQKLHQPNLNNSLNLSLPRVNKDYASFSN